MKRTTLPTSLDAEQGVLGGVLLRPEVLSRLTELEADDFYAPQNRAVWSAIRELESAKRPIDSVTIAEVLDRLGTFEAVGGFTYLGELAIRVPTPENVVAYAEIVRRKASTRRIVLGLSEVVERVRTDGLEGDDLAAEIGEVMAEHKRRTPAGGVVMGDVVRSVWRQALDMADRRSRGESVSVGVHTGIGPLDDHTGGVPIGSPAWVAARPGGAKTTVMQGFAEYMASTAGEGGLVLYLSNEDNDRSFGARLLAGYSGVPTQRIRNGDVADRDAVSRLGTGVQIAARSRVVFEKIHGKSGKDVARIIKRHHYDQSGRRLISVFVDYVQNMANPPRIHDRTAALGYNVQSIGDVAGELDCALVGGVQLKRDIDSRPWTQGGPVPLLADLKGSGDLEQAGKWISGIFHPWSHAKILSDGTREDHRTKQIVPRNLLELHLLKNFEGEAGGVVIPLRWDYAIHRVAAWVDAFDAAGQPSIPFDDVPHPAQLGR